MADDSLTAPRCPTCDAEVEALHLTMGRAHVDDPMLPPRQWVTPCGCVVTMEQWESVDTAIQRCAMERLGLREADR